MASEGHRRVGFRALEVTVDPEAAAEDNNSKMPTMRRRAAESLSLSDEQIIALSKDDDPATRTSLAIRGDLPTEAQRNLAADSSDKVRLLLAENTAIGVEASEMLTTNLNSDLCHALLKYQRRMSETAMRRLHTHIAVRVQMNTMSSGFLQRVMMHPSAPPALLAATMKGVAGTLKRSEVFGVKHAALSNPSMPLEHLEAVAAADLTDKDCLGTAWIPSQTRKRGAAKERSRVRLHDAVAANPGAPLAMLEELAERLEASYAKWLAVGSGDKFNVLFTRSGLEAIAANPTIPLPRIRDMIERHGPMLIESIARNHSADLGLLQHAAALIIPDMMRLKRKLRFFLAHPSIDDDLLATLLPFADSESSVSIAEHSAADERTFEALMASRKHTAKAALIERTDVPTDYLAIIKTQSQVVKLAIAQHPNTSARTLQRLAADKLHSVRRAAAGHPRTENAVRAMLMMDSDESVRKAATAAYLKDND